MSNFSNVVFSDSSPLPRTLFYFNYIFARLLSLKQIPTFSVGLGGLAASSIFETIFYKPVGERLGAPDVANKSHRYSRLRTFTK